MINILGHIANLLYAFGFLIKDVLGLRLVFSSAIIMEIIYSWYVAERPLWTNIIWCFVYLAVNGWQIVQLLLERRTILLGAEEKKLYEKVFFDFSVRDFLKVLKSGKFENRKSGDVIVAENEDIEKLILLIKGKCDIIIQEKKIALIEDYTFIGEMGFLSGEPASATVIAEEECRVLIWDKEELLAVMKKDSGINVCMQAIFTSDIINKLRKQNKEVLVKLSTV